MKNSARSAYKIKKSMMISTAAIVICLIGLIIEFVSKKTIDETGCMMLACNAVILSGSMEAYEKARQEEKPVITKM